MKRVDMEALIMREDEEPNVFFDALDKESDRALGIIAVCWLDRLLENLISASYIDDRQVKSLFKNEHILQTFFAKVNIAYFTGLIPKFMYHDLKLLTEIRNRFAHDVIAALRFNDPRIAERIRRCEIRPRELDDIDAPRLVFTIIVTIIGRLLISLERMLSAARPPRLMDIYNMDEMPYDRIPLTRSEISEILAERRKQTPSD